MRYETSRGGTGGASAGVPGPGALRLGAALLAVLLLAAPAHAQLTSVTVGARYVPMGELVPQQPRLDVFFYTGAAEARLALGPRLRAGLRLGYGARTQFEDRYPILPDDFDPADPPPGPFDSFVYRRDLSVAMAEGLFLYVLGEGILHLEVGASAGVTYFGLDDDAGSIAGGGSDVTFTVAPQAGFEIELSPQLGLVFDAHYRLHPDARLDLDLEGEPPPGYSEVENPEAAYRLRGLGIGLGLRFHL